MSSFDDEDDVDGEVKPKSFTVKLAASDTSSSGADDNDDALDVALLESAETEKDNVTLELNKEIKNQDASFEKMIDQLTFSDDEEEENENKIPKEVDLSAANASGDNAYENNNTNRLPVQQSGGVDKNKEEVKNINAEEDPPKKEDPDDKTNKSDDNVNKNAKVDDIITEAGEGEKFDNTDGDAFEFQEYNEDGDYEIDLATDELNMDAEAEINQNYESSATQEARHLLSKKEQEIIDLKSKRSKELYALKYIREQEMKRMAKIRRLERLLRHVDVMQVQFDARIMQLKNTIDELQAEMLVAESVARARQNIPIEDGFENGYNFSPTEADGVVTSMAERSMRSHSTFVSAQTFPLAGSSNILNFDMKSDDDDNYNSVRPFVSSNSSYPNMIKRLVNAYAGRPNLSGRASTESHRLLREKLRKVLDWNY
eukprot:g9170.t1